MQPHENLIASVQDWMKFASDDLHAAQGLAARLPDAPWIVAYHAQQCAEKSLKGYLTFRSVQFPFTHSISALRELVVAHAAWAKELSEADALTEFATTARYPGVGRPVSIESAGRSIEQATKVYEQVRQALADEGLAIK
jgi:HEPN domain-containing protein